MGVVRIGVRAAVGRAGTSDEAGAVAEHIIRFCQCTGAPFRTYIDGLQRLAVVERVVEARYVGGVPCAQVDLCQFSASVEQVAQACCLAGVKVADVKTSQFVAVAEHVTDVRGFAGVKVAQVELREVGAAAEH